MCGITYSSSCSNSSKWLKTRSSSAVEPPEPAEEQHMHPFFMTKIPTAAFSPSSALLEQVPHILQVCVFIYTIVCACI